VADPIDTIVSSVFRMPGRGPDDLALDPWYVARTPASGAFAWLDDLDDATDAALDDLLRRRLDLENFR
jgi:hypothetical protein